MFVRGGRPRGFSAKGSERGRCRARTRRGKRSSYGPTVVVDATGRDTFASRKPGAKIKTPRLERTLAIFSHYEGCHRMQGDDEGDIRIVIVPGGWFWVIPFRGDAHQRGRRAGARGARSGQLAISMPC